MIPARTAPGEHIASNISLSCDIFKRVALWVVNMQTGGSRVGSTYIDTSIHRSRRTYRLKPFPSDVTRLHLNMGGEHVHDGEPAQTGEITSRRYLLRIRMILDRSNHQHVPLRKIDASFHYKSQFFLLLTENTQRRKALTEARTAPETEC